MALFGKFSGNSDTIGIDIGSHTIKLVQLQASRTGYTVSHVAQLPTPAGMVKQGVIEDRVAVAEALRELLHGEGISATQTVAAVAGPAVVVRQIRMPTMTEAQLRKTIAWEARNYLSFAVEDSLLDFEVLSTANSDDKTHMDVMLVATPRELVDTRVGALELAGLEPIVVELEPFALMRGVLSLPGDATLTDETIAFVEIGATYTHISIASKGQFVLTRSVTTAGNSFTDAIASALEVKPEEAERIKSTEVEMSNAEEVVARRTPQGQRAVAVLEPLIGELTREIRRSFAFFTFQQEPGGGDAVPASVSRVILSGGGAQLKCLAQYLQEQLALPVTVVNNFGSPALQLPDRIDAVRAQAPLFATAFGLALREPMLNHEKGGHR